MKKQYVLMPIILLIAIMFSACTMSASTPPPVTPTTNLSEIARQATQTAIAKTPKGDTPVPGTTTAAEATTEGTQTGGELPTSTPVPSTATPTTEAEDITTEYAVPDSYTLKQGEFVYCLARRWNINPTDILNLNGLDRGDILFPGETIQVPSNPRKYPGQRSLRFHPDTYTVQPGDTLNGIACLYGDVDPRAIAAANDLDVDQTLTSGQSLQIP